MTTKDERNLQQVLSRIAEMPEPQRAVIQRVHEVVLKAAPGLRPRIWYGMPGYARSASSPVLVFLRHDELMTLGVSEKAAAVPGAERDGRLRPSAWYLDGVDRTTEERVTEIVRAAVAAG